MAQYLIVRDALARALGEEKAREHLVFVTDPEVGALRRLARAEGITTLDIPANVGGRFSVLSPVGLLPAALIGIDIRALLSGAADMTRRAESDDLSQNPAGVFAVMQWLGDTRHGRHIQALMPYADPLRDLALWFVQLWAESLGKDPAPMARSPVRPRSRHWARRISTRRCSSSWRGPRDKTVTFITVRSREGEGPIPARHGDIPELAYLRGHTLGELLDIERRATAGCAGRARPLQRHHHPRRH
jgi:glucose-6-phosphate isomerase